MAAEGRPTTYAPIIPFPPARRVEATAVAGIAAIPKLVSVRRETPPFHVCQRWVLFQKCAREDHATMHGIQVAAQRHARRVRIGRKLTHSGIKRLSLREHLVALSFSRFLLQQRPNANPSRLAAEMSAECICPGKTPPAPPCSASFETPTTDKLLLPRVQPLVAFPVVLARKRLPADSADEWSLVCVRAEVRTEIIRTREAFRTESALESSRVFLHALVTGAVAGTAWTCQAEKVIPIGEGVRG